MSVWTIELMKKVKVDQYHIKEFKNSSFDARGKDKFLHGWVSGNKKVFFFFFFIRRDAVNYKVLTGAAVPPFSIYKRREKIETVFPHPTSSFPDLIQLYIRYPRGLLSSSASRERRKRRRELFILIQGNVIMPSSSSSSSSSLGCRDLSQWESRGL